MSESCTNIISLMTVVVPRKGMAAATEVRDSEIR